MKYLSIYNNEYEVKDFLLKNGFITQEDFDDEMYDLLVWFEGDPDWVDIKEGDGRYYRRIYFATFHPDWKYEGEQVCIHTGDCESDLTPVREYLENSAKFTGYEPNRWEEMEKDKQHDFKVAFRGGMGMLYALSFA